jgi:hypothetical protein
MNKNNFYIFILYFLIYFGFSFYQYYETMLDGDLLAVVLPTEPYKKVLADPVGTSVIFNHEIYNVPNRFFAHWQQYNFFNNVPLWLQVFFDPIVSLFVSAAISKLLIHILFIYLLACVGVGSFSLKNKNLWWFAVLIAPLFQAGGPGKIRMSIISPYITYTYFYSLGVLWVLLFFSPIFIEQFSGKKLKIKKYFVLFSIIMAPIIALNGAINAPIVIIIGFIYFLYLYSETYGLRIKIPDLKWHRKNLSNTYTFGVLIAVLLSFYSFYLGTFNAETLVADQFTLSEMYLKLFKGVAIYFLDSFGPLIILIAIGINLFLIHKKKLQETKSLLTLGLWLILFVVIYTLLLPLGGYRAYRPYIVRADTYLPVTLILIFYFGKTSLVLFQNQKSKIKLAYIPLVLIFFTVRNIEVSDDGHKERQAMYQLANSKDEVTVLKTPATVVSWYAITKPEENKDAVLLLKRLKIVNRENLFYSTYDPYPH